MSKQVISVLTKYSKCDVVNCICGPIDEPPTSQTAANWTHFTSSELRLEVSYSKRNTLPQLVVYMSNENYTRVGQYVA